MTTTKSAVPVIVGSAVLAIEALTLVSGGLWLALGPGRTPQDAAALLALGILVTAMGFAVGLTAYGFSRRKRWSFALTVTWQLLALGTGILVVASAWWITVVLAIVATVGLVSAIAVAKEYFAPGPPA